MTGNEYGRPQSGVPLPLWPDAPPDWRPKAGADGFRPSLTPMLLPAETSKGFVLVCPGGGYGGRAPHEGEPIGAAFNRLGFSAGVLAYRTGGECEMPLADGPLRDLARAVRIVRAHAASWGAAPDRVAVLGFSAGGHLVGSLAVRHAHADQCARDGDGLAEVSSRPDAVVPCYAVLSTVSEYIHRGSVEALAGAGADSARLWDVPSQVAADTPPCFLWHTADDAAVPVQNSLSMAEALRARAIPFALHVYAHGQHGLGLAEDHPEIRGWPELAARWLEQIAFAPTPAGKRG